MYGFGRVSAGRGGAGFGFRGSSPPWPYVGRGRGGLPRCQYPSATSLPRYTPSVTSMTREQELDFLKGQTEVLKRELEQMESRIRDLETNK